MVALTESGSEKEKKMKTKGKADKKRQLETAIADEAESKEDPNPTLDDEEGPALKKPKINETEEKILQELQECETLLGMEDKTLSEKSQALARFLNSVVDNNVNTLLLKEDFPGWIKTWIIVVVDGTTKVSDDFLKFLGSALIAAPTAFEPILEKIMNVCFFYPRKGFTVEVYEDFMVRLVGVFERLRRFPKFIAKLLCCARENLLKNLLTNKQDGRKSIKAVSVDSKFLIEQILTPKLREAMGLVMNLLPVGQVVDLWKTYHHNLDVECIKRISTDPGDRNLHTFLAIVAELFSEFLSNAKVADYSVPASTIDKVADLMLALRDECLKSLALSVKRRNVASEVVKSFLKLSYAWVELAGVMVWYNPQCKLQLLSSQAFDEIEDCAATNLSMMHSSMDCNDWISQCNIWINRQEPELTFLIVKLISQKLRLLVAHQQLKPTSLISSNSLREENRSTSDEEDEDMGNKVIKLIKESADFIWTHQDFVKASEMKETLTLVADYVPSQRLMELASNLVKQLQINNQADPDVQDTDLKRIENQIANFDNPRLHFALVLEALGEITRRIGKMKLLSKFIKSILSNTLSIENRAKLLNIPFIVRAKSSKISSEYLQIAKSLSTDVNTLLNEAVVPDQLKKTEEFSGTLIDGMMAFVCGLDIENYPLEIKTIVFLCSVVILFALSEQKSNDSILSRTVNILTSSCIDSQGNEVLFGIRWIDLFKWVDESGLLLRLDNHVQKLFCNAVLSNIYLSQKSASEFEENELKTILSEDVTPDKLSRILHLLGFLIQELNYSKPSNKITPMIKKHAEQLTGLVSNWLKTSGDKLLKKLTKSDQDPTDFHIVILRAFELIGTAYEVLQIPVDETLKSTIISGVNVAVCITNPEKLSDLNVTNSSTQLAAASQALKFVHTVYTNKDELWGNLKATLHKDLWERSCSTVLWKLNVENQRGLLPKRFVKDLFELSNPEDFQNMCTALPSVMKSDENSEEENRFMVSYLMEEMLEAELSAEKKPWRRKTVEEYLHSMFSTLLLWNSTDSILVDSVIPYIQFQTKLVRRRNAMIPLKSLAICLASVTSVPFDQIDNIQLYRKVFCITGDLMNALVIHRADALSSRTHVYLQCFQYLVDGLAKKADQRNKLRDEDIYDLRHCAHSIERMCQSIKTGQKEFSRISPYFVAVIMRQFEIHTVYPSIKNSLQNGVYKLLDMCDDNGVAQLNAMLTIGSREIFRTTYDLYKKYYKYRGKV